MKNKVLRYRLFLVAPFQRPLNGTRSRALAVLKETLMGYASLVCIAIGAGGSLLPVDGAQIEIEVYADRGLELLATMLSIYDCLAWLQPCALRAPDASVPCRGG